MKSSLGTVLASLFFIFSVIIFIYAISCESGVYCGLIAVLPAMPWVLLPLSDFLPHSWGNSIFILFFISLLNTMIVYFIGALIQQGVAKLKKIR